MKKYAYLSSDSSYTISAEDGVEVLLPDNSSAGEEKKTVNFLLESSNFDASNSQNDSNSSQSFTVEAQVVFCFLCFKSGRFFLFILGVKHSFFYLLPLGIEPTTLSAGVDFSTSEPIE